MYVLLSTHGASQRGVGDKASLVLNLPAASGSASVGCILSFIAKADITLASGDMEDLKAASKAKESDFVAGGVRSLANLPSREGTAS